MSHFSFTARLLRIVTPAHYLHFLTSCSLLNPLKSGFSSYSSTYLLTKVSSFALITRHQDILDPCRTLLFAALTRGPSLPTHPFLTHLLVGLPSLCILHGCFFLLILCMWVFSKIPSVPFSVCQFIKVTDFTTSSILVVPVSSL